MHITSLVGDEQDPTTESAYLQSCAVSDQRPGIFFKGVVIIVYQ